MNCFKTDFINLLSLSVINTSFTMRKNKKGYNMQIIDHIYDQVPAFTDVFDEETWYIFVACFVAATLLLAFLLSRCITLKPVA